MSSRIAPVLAWALILVPVTSPVHGQSPSSPIAASPLAPDTAANTRPLGVDEAIALGLQNNLGVQVNRYTPYAAQYESEAAWGAYNPMFRGDIAYGEQTLQNSFATNDPTESERLSGTAELSALIPYWGGSLNLGFDGMRAETNSRVESLSPRYDTGLTLGVTAPLLRGLIWNEAWTQVKMSKLAYQGQIDDFTALVMDTVLVIINSYWDLVATQEQVRVAEKSLESTQALLEQTRVQYEVGVVSRVEVIQAEAGVANSEFNLIVSKNDYMNAQDRLIADVLGRRLQADTTLRFNPTDNPPYVGVDPVDVTKAVETAFQNRPELGSADKRIQQGEVALRFAKNQRLPRFDVNFEYRTTGTVGSVQDTIFSGPPPFPGYTPPTNVGGFGDTFDYYYQRGGPRELSALGIISIPIGNTTARKNVSRARIELRQAESQITQLEQNIIVSVRRSARGLLASAQGVEAAERRRIAAAEQLRAENIRLEHGESTPFDVLQRERDLVDAESQKIGALQAFRVSQANLQREEGTILSDRNVVIEQVRRLD